MYSPKSTSKQPGKISGKDSEDDHKKGDQKENAGGDGEQVPKNGQKEQNLNKQPSQLSEKGDEDEHKKDGQNGNDGEEEPKEVDQNGKNVEEESKEVDQNRKVGDGNLAQAP